MSDKEFKNFKEYIENRTAEDVMADYGDQHDEWQTLSGGSTPREVHYKFCSYGIYCTDDDTRFGDDTYLKLCVEPHKFSIAVSSKILRESSLDGYTVIVSRNGEAVFYDCDGKVIGVADKTGKSYREVRLVWKNSTVSVEFGSVQTVDNYPHCDGEYDRWSEEWVVERIVALDVEQGTVTAE